MFISNQPENQLNKYINLLQRVASLSDLFSNNVIPYIHPRATENIFCKAFEANNHSRADTSADAGKNGLGIGIKTFISKKSGNYEKIAEFNKKQSEYRKIQNDDESLIHFISELRNKRIDFAKSSHNLDNLIYHCICREEKIFALFEEPMKYVDLSKIKLTKKSESSIFFTDGNEDYLFNFSKSTLFKKFNIKNTFDFPVSILKDPYDFIEGLTGLEYKSIILNKVYLPLYSSQKGIKLIPEKSGLNQWNASGRPRNVREVYIPIPIWIHKVFTGFFPPRDQSFNLKLPNGEIIQASICQEGGKALMSNPNSKLGEWLIDRVLKIETGKIVTYSVLEDVGVDSVEVRKIDENNFEIDFKAIGTFERFKEENKEQEH